MTATLADAAPAARSERARGRSWVFLWSVVVAAIARSGVAAELPPPAAGKVDYEGDVRPLFEAHCLRCHGPEKQESGLRVDRRADLLRGGDFGEPSMVPGDSAGSFLVRVVAGTDPDLQMPPEGKRLSGRQVGLLRAWIDQGAKMGDATEAPPSVELTHWAYQPRHRPRPPRLPPDWGHNAIDAWVFQSASRQQVALSPPADRISLIRRLYLVMHGLPPTPAEVTRFLADQRPDAWQRLVDRVLASPRYGERWARHWLDIIKFGETHGFETNRERPHAWRYRDYVVQSLNRDQPYDRFVLEQLAGDALDAEVATGFLVAGPYDLVKSPDINLTLMQRQDELADMINTTGTALLGLTLGCARCHNHKFDPVTQRDYYSLQAIFAGVHHGDRPLGLAPDQLEQLHAVRQRIHRLQVRLARFLPPPQVPFIDLDDRVTEATRGLVAMVPPAGTAPYPPGTDRGYAGDPGSPKHGPHLGRGSYTWWDDAAGRWVAAYRPLVRGRFRVWLSWASGAETHSRDAEYWLDHDGDATTSDDRRRIAVVDQQRFADGTGPPGDKPLWSGLYDAGIHDLETTDVILLRGGSTGPVVTADVVLLESSEDQDPSGAATGFPPVRPPANTQLNVERLPPTPARWVRFTVSATNNNAQPCLDELELYSGDRNVALATEGAVASCSSTLPGYAIHQLEHIHDGLHGNSHSWISNEPGAGWVQIELPQTTSIDRIVWGRDREGRFTDRLATRYRIEVAVEPDRWVTVATSDDRLPGKREAAWPDYQFEGRPAAEADEGRRWRDQLQAARRRLADLADERLSYCGTFEQPGPTHRLYRGEPTARREVVPPNTIAALGDLELDDDAPEQSRRLALARWIVRTDNPLTARVAVNRLWQHHFGTGLVATPSDFGSNGTLPTHPELLDWLASELVDHGWSLKHVHRQILNSATWRQSSRPRADMLEIDAAARQLWRYPPRRLEAEAIRDSVLAASGALDERMGGPGFSAFEVQQENVRHYFPKSSYGPPDWRRMIYMTKVRQEQDAVFGAFDCPDASQVIARRSRSTTPLQALNLLNSHFVMQQAELMAERLRRDAGGDLTRQIQRAFQLCFGREPDKVELESAVRFAERFGTPLLCRALFNANEFLFLP